jgi:hypothetical protein
VLDPSSATRSLILREDRAGAIGARICADEPVKFLSIYLMGYSQAQKVQGHEKILVIAGLQPGSAKSDVRCSPCSLKVIHDLDVVIVVLYRGLGSPFNAG